MSEEPIITKIENDVYWIKINRPDKLNSITSEMLDLLSYAIDQANDPKIKCIVITGSGDRAFSAGADIKDFQKMTKEQAKMISQKGQNTFKKLLKTPKPIIAAVNGYALGGGCELSLFCDYRIASDKARFSQPEVNLGLIPGWGGTYMLQKLVGKTLAYEMITTGRRLNAEEALNAGLVNHVYPSEEFNEKLNEFIEGIRSAPPISLSYLKKLYAKDTELDKAFEAESEKFSKLWDTDDLMEGLKAFSERRKPVFKGE